MSKAVPERIGGAKLICHTLIDERHRFTGNTRQIVAGKLMGPMAGLAICPYDGDEAFYLFGCDPEWNSLTDTWHQSLDEAKDQAEFEYEGAKWTWITAI
jgi:hypothetical protein